LRNPTLTSKPLIIPRKMMRKRSAPSINNHPKDVRRKTKFISPRIVIRTSSKGITDGPKAAARPMIQSKMATVKIVQNTGFSLRENHVKKIK